MKGRNNLQMHLKILLQDFCFLSVIARKTYTLSMIGNPLTEFVFTTSTLIFVMVLVAFVCCVYIRLSDIHWARRRNVPCHCPGKNVGAQQIAPLDDGCAIYIPSVPMMIL